ncbi:hypothetical protein F2Q69_00013239 [Brassica cretica]|uniref:Uncharacterized protein n=1 Tax=Brassica cretica TaxID=69181 RepID=A0A8S9R5A2_BRACR|nr:hypothetical protein F2Q69_00013239 [Brassica cretica]
MLDGAQEALTRREPGAYGDETQLFPLGLETDLVTSRRVSLEHLPHVIATVREAKLKDGIREATGMSLD